jgi:hypothetical protein
MIVRILEPQKFPGANADARQNSCPFMPAGRTCEAVHSWLRKHQPAENPCQSSSGRIHSRSWKAWIAVDYALDQVLGFRCIHQKTNVPRMIDERKSERQSPGIKLWHKIRNHSARRFFNARGTRKQGRGMAILSQA